MAGYNLPENIDTTYSEPSPDTGGVQVHQQHHDTVHGFVNKFDKDGVPDAGYGWVYEATSTAPTVLGTSISSTTSGFSSLSTAHTLQAGTNRRVFIFISLETPDVTTGAASFVTSVTYGGVAATRVTDGTTVARADAAGSFTRNFVEIWEVLEANLPADGTKTVSVSLASTAQLAVYVTCMADCDQGANAQLVVSAPSTSSGQREFDINMNVVNFTTVLDVVSVENSTATITVDADQTLIDIVTQPNGSFNAGVSLESETGGDAAVTMGWSTTVDNLRSAHAAVALSGAGVTNAGLYVPKQLGSLDSTAKSNSYTLTPNDAGKVIETSAGIVIPLDASTNLPVGYVCEIFKTGGTVTVSVEGGASNIRVPNNQTLSSVTLNKTYGSIVLRKRGADNWVAQGDMSEAT